uniref:THAP-type domain-containing protein n=1 Tax=Rhabditophanes sp. KR3021 TaxID=114890 RepID=A0AC35TWY0_9BILA
MPKPKASIAQLNPKLVKKKKSKKNRSNGIYKTMNSVLFANNGTLTNELNDVQMKYMILQEKYDDLNACYSKLINENTFMHKRRSAVQSCSPTSRLGYIKEIYTNFVCANSNSPPDKQFIESLTEYFEFHSCAIPVSRKKYTIDESVKLLLETQNRFKILLRHLLNEKLSPSYCSIEKVLREKATGNYEYAVYKSDESYENVAGCFATNIEEILKERIQNLYENQNLVYKKTTDGRGNDTYQINCCVGGDSGQGSCKFNIQPQLKNTNHSALALSIIAFWFGKDTRKLMEHFLQIPMQQIDYINLNGFNTTINRKNVKIDVKFYFCSDFMTTYNFFGLKGQCSRYFCYLCTLESGSNKLDDYNYRVAEYRSLKHSANNLEYSEKALPLSTTIRAEDTITP